MSDTKPVREDFIREAKLGNWTWVDNTLSDSLISEEDFRWAMTLAEVDEHQAVHLLGAKYLAISERPFEKSRSRDDKQHVALWLRAEPNADTQQQLTLALWKRE